MGTNQTLIGEDENGDGEPDYKSQVSWMPFVGNMVAFHDASWRKLLADHLPDRRQPRVREPAVRCGKDAVLPREGR